MRIIKMLLSVAVLFGLLGAASASASMSNKTRTTWTLPNHKTQLYMSPRWDKKDGSRKLEMHTPNGSDNVVVVNKEIVDGLGDTWVQIRVAGKNRPLIRWVKRNALSSYQVNHTRVVVSLRQKVLTAYRGSKVLYRTKVGVGKNGTPTARGSFWIAEKFTGSQAIYGSVTFGTTARSPKGHIPGFGSVIGIHGTQGLGPSLGAVSHGCIRVPNINKLASFVGLGSRVDIQ